MSSCLHPIKISYSQFRMLSEKNIDIIQKHYKLKSSLEHIYTNGKQEITIDSSGFSKTKKTMLVDCGYCYHCRTKKANEWSLRVSQQVFQDRINDKKALFLTLTYSNDNLPVEGVQLEDVQKFLKRLRKHLVPFKCELSADAKITKKFLNSRRFQLKLLPEKDNFKYFGCAEYGTLRGRPHYHFIITGFKNSITKMTKLINSVWNKGYVYVTSCTPATVNYVARYMIKDYDLILKPQEYIKKNKREYPFRLVSKAFGKEYLLNNLSSVLENKFFMHNSIKYAIPRTYLRWIRVIIGSDKFYEVFTKSFNQHKIFKFLEFLAESELDLDDVKYAFDDDLYSIINHDKLLAFYLNKLKSLELEAQEKHKKYVEMKRLKNMHKLYDIA